MALGVDLPCDGDGMCFICKKRPPAEETLTCKTCATPWHAPCLSSPPPTMGDALRWDCPDCSMVNPVAATAAPGVSQTSPELIAAIRAIHSDESLTDEEKARKRQQLLSGKGVSHSNPEKDKAEDDDDDVLDVLDEKLKCSVCMKLPERPVTTPCGHNFCLKCFQRWIGQGKSTCVNCRHQIPSKMAQQPRINSTLVLAIRMARMSKSGASAAMPSKPYQYVHNQDRPDKAFTTERAKKAGKANACSGKVFVTVPPDHFGPILAENDPVRNIGVLVGDSWNDRLDCRQWGVHLPHVAGIAGQSKYGAQSVALSGGYEDDEDHGEWFLYTGSGGRDLSGNKRTNKEHSFDQKFEKSNEALRVSCRYGYPVRVVRSHKEKRSSYAPETGVRYDGIYRIEKCWRKNGKQGFKVCRYLFVRCDNEPAPWTSDNHGDRPRPLPAIKELNNALDLTERKQSPSWDYDDEKGCWTWKKPPPPSRLGANGRSLKGGIKLKNRKGRKLAMKEKLLKEFGCQICLKVMTNPLTTPCGHNFCKGCLESTFAGQSLVRERGQGRRTLRAQKNVMKCPSCKIDIADFLQNPQVNRQLMDVIESLQQQTAEMESSGDSTEDSRGTHEKPDCESDAGDVSYTKIMDEGADKDEAESKPEQTYEQKGTNGGNDMPTVDGDNGSTLPKESGPVKCENEIASKDTETDDIKEAPANAKPRLSHKRKKADDAGNQQMVSNGGRKGGKRNKSAVA